MVWFWAGLVVMGGPDSNRDLCKIGNWACRILFMPLGNTDTICVEKISFVEMIGWVGALEKGEEDT